jgi:uncharacterized protein (TIGR00251 family)
VNNIITAKVTPRCSKNEVVLLSENIYKLKITASPIDNMANIAVIKLLSDYFSVPKSCIQIIHGLKSRTKVIKIFS